MKQFTFLIAALVVAFVFVSCTGDEKMNQSSHGVTTNGHKVHKAQIVHRKSPAITYKLETARMWFAAHKDLTAEKLRILTAVNRTDDANLKTLKMILVPSDLTGDVENYLPFPVNVASLKEIDKILLFSYPTQTFAAYENGDLVYTGPTNMGRKKDPTPTGLYFTNWKAEKTTSTFNDEWDLKWNFNIENKEGIGFHQYVLPGYPASHSCLRLKEEDAKYLYDWADQWELKGTDDILAKGTPVIVFGVYNFDGPKPWLQLTGDPAALKLTADDITATVGEYLPKITEAQLVRQKFFANKK